MKKTTRLTALLLALVLLLGTLSASATGTGIPIEDLDLKTYSSMLMTAEEGMLGEDLTDPCGMDNVYCQYIENDMSGMTAHEIHAELTDLYENQYSEYIALMLHYGYYHLDSELVCICEIPMPAPEDYPVGDLTAHTESDCPWRFENLTTAEQYSVVCLMTADEQAPYLETLSTEQATALETYTAQQESSEPVLSESCSADNEYCVKVGELVALPTAQERYEYMMDLYSEDATDTTLEGVMLHYYYYKTEHNADGLICECDFPSLAPEYKPGALEQHEDGCPWEFENLTTAEQYSVVCLMTADEQAPYLETLSAEQTTALETYTAQQNGTLSYPCEEKPEYCQYSVYSQMTATEIYNYFNGIYDDGNGEISDLYAAMMLHYGEYHLDSSLICTCGEHPLPLPEYQIGDISKHETTCPWHFANLTTAEQYSVVCLMTADEQAPYLETLSAEQTSALETYTAQQNGTLSYPCEEKPEYCQYSVYSQMTATEIYNYFNGIYDDGNGEISDLYAAMMLHYGEYHLDSSLICTCGEHPLPLPEYQIGDISKHESTCPWHFTNLTASEQAIVIGSMSDKEKNSYLTTLTGAQRAALYAELDMGSDSTVDNTTELAASEATGTAAQITVPANTFGEGVDYVMSAFESELNEDERAAVTKAGGGSVLATFDISFNNLTTGEEIQPQDGNTVTLTFTIDTTKITASHIQVYHMEETVNEDSTITYTAEPLGEPVEVDKSLTEQTITVEASEFSLNTVAGECDGTSCKTITKADTAATDASMTYVDNGDHNYEAMQSMTNTQICAYINELYTDDTTGTSIDAFMMHLAVYHQEWATANICSCYTTLENGLLAPGTGNHTADCPWYTAVEPTVVEIKDTATGITVTGALPAGTQLKVTDASATEIPELDTSHLTYRTVSQVGYDISLVDADGNPIADDAFTAVEVYVPGVWDTSYSDPIVDVYHLNDDGTLKELLTTRDGSASISEDGGVTMEVTGFSIYSIVSGQSSGDVTSGTHTLYIAPGTSGTLTLNSTSNVSLNTESLVAGVNVSRAAKNNQTTFTVTADDSAALGSSGTFTITWQGREGNSTATFTVMVASAEEVKKQAFLGNSIEHIQIDIESEAVVLGYNGNEATSFSFGYDGQNEYTLERESDESEVGFHYEMKYTSTAGIATTIIIRVDEDKTKLPDDIGYDDLDWDSAWEFNEKISIKENQISFDSSGYNIPVGTQDNPIIYSVTVETTLTLTPNEPDNAEARNVEVAISDSIGYWYSTNKCPGIMNNDKVTPRDEWENGKVLSNSGIDMSEFSTGEKVGTTTYYVVFSDLTKEVSGYTFGETGNVDSKNYVFTIYRRMVDDPTTTDVNEAETEWTAFDTISITLTEAKSASIDFTTDASKYDVANLAKYKYKIVETGYSLSGYSCANVIYIKDSDGNYVESAEGVFEFTQVPNTAENTVIYSAEIKCTNTYKEAGLTVTKKTENAPASAAGTEFTVKVWPNVLSREGLEAGADLVEIFNEEGTYKISGEDTTLTVIKDGSDTEYGYLEITLKGGDSKTITGLPAGTYYVQEVGGSDANWTYDTEKHTADLSSGSYEVTVTNTYKSGSLKVTKAVVKENDNVADPDTNQEFQISVTFGDSKTYSYQKYEVDGTVTGTATSSNSFTLKNGQYVIFSDVPANVTYTVTETNIPSNFTEGYDSYKEGSIVAGGTVETTVTNTYTKLKTANLTISKVVEGTDSTDPDFTFTVVLKDASGNTLTGFDKYKVNDTEHNIVKGQITLKAGQSAVIENIPVTSQYVVTEINLPTGYALKSGVAAEQQGTVTVDGSNTVTFINVYSTGSLAISKTVTGTNAPEDSFQFNVTLTGVRENPKYTVNDGTEQTLTLDSNGKGTITLYHGETATITGLPAGAGYVVDEQTNSMYTKTVDGNETGSIVTGMTTVEYSNEYNTGSLTITKEFAEGTTPEAGDTFLFTVKDNNGNVVAEVIIDGSAKNKSVTIKDLPIGTYTVTEDENWSWRYTADNAKQTATVMKGGDAQVTFTNSKTNDQWLDGNAYAENNFTSDGVEQGNNKVNATDGTDN